MVFVVAGSACTDLLGNDFTVEEGAGGGAGQHTTTSGSGGGGGTSTSGSGGAAGGGAAGGCGDGTAVAGEVCLDEGGQLGAPTDPRGVAVADIDEDGHDDVVVTFFGNGSNGGGMHFLGDGQGSFDVGVGIDLGSGGFGRVVVGAIADLDVDICAINHTTTYPTLHCVRGDGNGGFSDLSAHSGGDFDLELVDITHDGYLDYMTVGDNEFLLGFESNFAESFPTNASWLEEDALSFPIMGIAHGDFNADTHIDLVTTHPNTNQARVLRGDGSAGSSPFASSPVTILSVVAGPVDAAVGDFDGDQALDIALAVEERVAVRLGDGDGVGFGSEQVYAVGEGTVAIVTADFDQDGLDDVATANDSGTISVLRSIDGASFEPQLSIAANGGPVHLATGDFNEDGSPDIVYVSNLGVFTILSSP